eukprot:Hpha_TRINITY_DN34353_c0_g1::TRINITY_DN34353_c0_g1_i1::g.109586::m.109586
MMKRHRSVWRQGVLLGVVFMHWGLPCSCAEQEQEAVDWTVLSIGYGYHCKNATEDDISRDCSYADPETPPEWACFAEGPAKLVQQSCDDQERCFKVTVAGGGCDAAANATCGQACNGAGCKAYTRSVMIRVMGVRPDGADHLRVGQGALAALCPHRCFAGAAAGAGFDVCADDPAECKKEHGSVPYGCWPTAPSGCAPGASASLTTSSFVAVVERVDCPEGRQHGIGWVIGLTVLGTTFVVVSLLLWRKGRQKQGAMFERLMESQQNKTVEELTSVGRSKEVTALGLSTTVVNPQDTPPGSDHEDGRLVSV